MSLQKVPGKDAHQRRYAMPPSIISGMYYEWTKTTNDSEDVPYTCYFTDEGQGLALWHSDGVSYTLGMTENVTEELLVTMYGIVTGEAE